MSTQTPKGNIVANWDASYKGLNVTYSDASNSPADISNIFQHEAVCEDLKKYLESATAPKVVEIGCGGARTALFLSKQGFQVTCSDNSPEALRLARDNFEAVGAQGEFVADDLLNTKLAANSFDAVISFGLLEHFEDVQKVIQVASDVIRPGGIHAHVIIPKKFSTQTVANAAMFPLRLGKNLIANRKPWNTLVARSFRDFPHYENSYSHTEYMKFFENTGNEVLRCEAWDSLFPLISLPRPLGGIVARNFGKPIKKMMHKLYRQQSPAMHAISSGIYIVARKR
ncbi:MAG: hypothetical protein A2428_16290 [Bdellovibrionales bacterium RIFOXYC1_FULL_54_43]|nr:MAG: hypothetical protein A2428_16290 [Bdellovibrionales bacterium RIFOXYC1_FULL_54_43]OFZ83974.1 MAG: hypothetical protein A2603_10505 [Bdellovibrionales bacterium RIFOXYD1_FULL_55_31]